MPVLTIHAMTQLRECRFCGPVELEIEGPIETTPELLGEDIAQACEDEAERAHWTHDTYGSPVCPRCAWERRHLLADEHRADHPADADAA